MGERMSRGLKFPQLVPGPPTEVTNDNTKSLMACQSTNNIILFLSFKNSWRREETPFLATLFRDRSDSERESEPDGRRFSSISADDSIVGDDNLNRVHLNFKAFL